MKQGEIYRIEGSVFTRDALLAHSHMMVQNCNNPDWYRKVFAFIQLYLDPSAGPVLQRSSGTTGDPKEFRLERAAMETSARKTLDFFGLKAEKRVLLGLSVDYIAGKMMVVRALEGGLDLVLTEPSARPLKAVEGSFDFVPMVPMQVKESLNAGDDLGRCGTLLIGGGELSSTLRNELGSMASPRVFESFGMSETYTHFALRQLNGPDPEPSFRLLEGALIHTDTRGCLVVDLPGVTAHPVITNDLVEIFEPDEEGAPGFRWLGRIDNIINTGGIKIIPEILEKRISQWLGVPVLLLPFPDEKLGQKMVLLMEYGDGLRIQAAQIDQWKEILASNLSPHELPKDFIPVPEIPCNTNFKPDRKAAREKFGFI